VFIGIVAPDPMLIQPVCLTSILWSIGKEHKILMNAICTPPKRVSRLQSVGQRKSKTTYVLGGSIMAMSSLTGDPRGVSTKEAH
jgi:hypothetical protein